MLIEQIAQFYRLLLPFPLWLNFFSMYNDLSSAVSALFFTGLYTLLKVCIYDTPRGVTKAHIPVSYGRFFSVSNLSSDCA